MSVSKTVCLCVLDLNEGWVGLGGPTEVDYQPSYLSDSKEGGCSKGFSILSELEFELIGS